MSASDAARDRSGATPATQNPPGYRGLPPSFRTSSYASTHNPTSPLRFSPGVAGGSSSHGGTPHHHSSSSEDALVLEVGSKFLRAGFANEPHPRCVLAWNKGMGKRSGDKVGLEEVVRRRGMELWRVDVRGLDLGLVEDVLERGVREAYHKYLLIDSKTKKLILPVPPLFPTRLLTSMIATLFSHFQPPSMTLLPAPVLATVAAGLRSALVVDIGWYETVVTPVYDLRAIEGRGIGVAGRSKRGVKSLRRQWVRLLTPPYRRAMGLEVAASAPEGSGEDENANDKDEDDYEDDDDNRVSKSRPNLNDVSEAMERLGWCRPLSSPLPDAEHTYRLTKIPLPSSSTSITLPFSDLALPAERTFFAPTTERSAVTTTPPDAATAAATSKAPPVVAEGYPDDDDFPLPRLLYNTLMRCTIDVRAACLSRIVFTGGGSRIPGLQTRAVEELQVLVDKLKWDVSPGAGRRRRRPGPGTRRGTGVSARELHQDQDIPVEDEDENEEEEEEEEYDWHSPGPASHNLRDPPAREGDDDVDDHHSLTENDDDDDDNDPTTTTIGTLRNNKKKKQREKLGQARAVKTLGVWAGGSLVGGLKIRGKVELERDKFLTAVAAGGNGLPPGAF